MHVGDQPRSVGFDGFANGLHDEVWPGHVVEAIEGGDEIVTSIAGQRIDGRVVQMHVLYPGLPRVFFRAPEGQFSDVVSVKLRPRVSLCHLDDCNACAATDIRNLSACMQLSDDAVKPWQGVGYKLRSKPRGEQSFDADIHFRTELVIRQPESAFE